MFRRMERLASRLLELQIFKRFSARQKLLAYLYVSYLWSPLRDKMKRDRRLRRCVKSRAGSAVSNENSDGEIDFDETSVCLPRLPKLAVIYYFISSGTHLVICLHSILLKSRTVAEDQIADDFITCYMPRVHFHEIMQQKYMIWFNLLFSSLHLIHRGSLLVFGCKFRLDAVTFMLIEEADFNQGWLTTPPSLIQSNAIGSFSESILFLRINLARRRRVGLKLRPSRTPEARRELTRLIDLSFILSIVCLITPSITLGPVGISQILFSHEPIFEGCRISYYDSIYWFRTLTSLHICLVMLIDTYLQFTFPIGLISVLIVDLVQYWNAIEERMLYLRRSMGRLAYERPNWMDERESTSNRNNSSNMEQEFRELRALIGDFFKNLIRANGAVSMVIFFAFLVWFSSNAVVTFLGLQLSGSSNVVVRLFQVIGITSITAISHLVLYLKRRTKPAYTTLCSLMALDESKRKMEWIEIIRYYTDKRSNYAFTLLGAGVFDELMFFKFISYMITLTIFVETFQIHVSG